MDLNRLGRGVGRAMVSRVIEAIFAAGRAPHYAHAIANLQSAWVALRFGYWPAWVEVSLPLWIE